NSHHVIGDSLRYRSSVIRTYVSYLIMVFFFTDPATTALYTLSLHDALPISRPGWDSGSKCRARARSPTSRRGAPASASARPRARDRKSTRLNSSHVAISYAVFCLKKKKAADTQQVVAGHSDIGVHRIIASRT